MKSLHFRRLEAAHHSAFEKFSAEADKLRRILRDPNPNAEALEAARLRVDEACETYRRRRNELADAVLADWATRANGPRHTTDEVHTLAYRLWEQAGRPLGNPDEHWYRAERLLHWAGSYVATRDTMAFR